MSRPRTCRWCGFQMKRGDAGYLSLHESLCAKNPKKPKDTCPHGYPQTVKCSRCGEL